MRYVPAVAAGLAALLAATLPAGGQADAVPRVAAPLGAGSAGAGAGPWFQDIQVPLALSEADGAALCRRVCADLKRGAVTEPSLSGVPGAEAPRVVFLSWSDGSVPACTRLGVGPTADAALQAACRAALASTPAATGLQWLKLDIVQHGEAVAGFSPRGSRLPLPSLIGLAFGPGAGFEFLPEQLVSWDMVDSEWHLAVHYVSERVIGQEYGRWLSEDERLRVLSRWAGITSYLGGQKVCLFETQSWFSDGESCIPLFRGHPLVDNASVESLRQAACEAGDRLVEYCTEGGHFECPLPEWEPGKPKGFRPRDQAEAILALVRLHQATGQSRYLEAARRAGDRLAAAVAPYGPGRRAGCLAETETVVGTRGVEAQAHVALTPTNALAVAALSELGAATGDAGPYRAGLAMLAQHLVAQLQPDGSVVPGREFPSQKIRAEPDAEGAPTCLLAFLCLYETTAREPFLEYARSVADHLRRTALAAEMDGLPREVWLMEALDRLFTFTRDTSLKEPVARLARAALLDQTREVDVPDGYGCVAGHISALPAAERSRLMAIGARLLRDLGQTESTDDLLGEARPFVLFQLQSRMTPATALYLPEPRRYLGLFRDHVLDFGFELRGQAAQILSAVALAREMERLGCPTLPEDEAVQKSLAAARAAAGHWPRCLTPQVAAIAAQSDEQSTIEFRDLGSQLLTVSPEPAPGGKGKARPSRQKLVPIKPARR